MRYPTRPGMVRQVRHAAQSAVKDDAICFGKLLPVEWVEAAIIALGIRFRDCLYTPLRTLWTFLHQVLGSDQSCRAAVARLLAFLSQRQGQDQGQGRDQRRRENRRRGRRRRKPASAKTDPYCKARRNLPEELAAYLARRQGAELHAQAPRGERLGGRPMVLGDGTGLSAPDTPENQAAYPRASSTKPGVGFPLLRLVALISLSAGAVLDVAIGPYSGKRTGETALLRQLLAGLRPGDIFIADALFANYWTIAMVRERGVDVLLRHDGKRKTDFRSGQRLGRNDHVITWERPPQPEWMDAETYQRMPETLSLRQVRTTVQPKGFRVRHVVLVTTLLDAALYPAAELASAYRLRWYAELDLRSIKCVMRMDVLRCKTPAMLRKEIWMHLLAYNLIRKLMAQAAAEAGCQPRQISFTGTLQTLTAFAPRAWGMSGEPLEQLYGLLLEAIATHRVGDRPDRVEPRAVKRRPKKHTLLNEPRAVAKARLLKGLAA